MIEHIEAYLKKKVDSYEIFYENIEVLSVGTQRGQADNVSEGTTEGIGVRVEIKKKIGMASTLNLKRYKECCDTALKFSKINSPDKHFVKFQEKQSYKPIKSLQKSLLNFNFEDAKTFCENVKKEVQKHNKEIKIPITNYTKLLSHIHIINSEGVDAERISGINSRFHELLLGENSLGFSDESLSPLDPLKVAPEVNRLLLLKKKSNIHTGIMPILLHPEALSDLMSESLHFSFDAENIFFKKSILASQLGERVFDKKISLTDDATLPGYIHSRSFDDEGAASQKNILIEKGVVKNFLYDSYYAHAAKKKSTANASRTVTSTPTISPSNLLLSPGTSSHEELLRTIDRGVYVKGLMGLHTMDASTGDFSLNISEGQLIEKGELKGSLRKTMIAGNFFTLLKEVEALGEKIEYTGQGHYLPHLLAKNVKVISS